MPKLKKTPLYHKHIGLKARMVEFGGWNMPVQYEGVIKEHNAVRSSAGIFDVSHMGEIEARGKEALSMLQYLTTNDVSRIEDMSAQYTVMCYPEGGAVDDLIIYRYSHDHYMLCVNASNREKDYNWIVENNETSAQVTDLSDDTAQLAIQGPQAEAVLQKLTTTDLSAIKYYHFQLSEVSGVDTLISRTGYTGEDGFEIFFSHREAESLWEAILEAGKDESIQPIGLGARDTLRLEMGYALYGHELDREHGPIPARLGWIVKQDKGDFIGREAIIKHKEEGTGEELVGFELEDRGIPRAGYHISKDGEHIGRVTSGTFSPSLKKGVGLAYVRSGYADVKTALDVEIRSSRAPARIRPLPFVKSGVAK